MISSAPSSGKTPGVLDILELSDVHIGHPKTTTPEVLATLYQIFSNTEDFAKVDIVFIAGDFFDRQLYLSSDPVRLVEEWILYFLRLCKKLDVVVRVLEGTPSHDWKQSERFIKLNEHAKIGCDVRYFSAMEIEHIDRFGIDVLYIPDEYRSTTDAVWDEVVQTLAAKNLDKVDYVVMHGAFEHQMPKHTHGKLQLHNADRYLSICRSYIFVGHVHLYSQYQRILSAGSTQRLSHGEEGPKGHLRVQRHEVYDDIITFVENRGAKKYITVACEKLDQEEALAKIQRALRNLPKDSHVRVSCRKQDPAITLTSRLELEYPNYHWSIRETGKNNTDAIILVDNRHEIQRLTIKPDNIGTLLLDRIRHKHPHLVDRCGDLLTEVLHE